jgi:FtsZ-binding cell division protein ZapB
MKHRTDYRTLKKRLSTYFMVIMIFLIILVLAKLIEIRDENRRLKVEIGDLRLAVQEIKRENSELKSTNEQLAEHIEIRNKAYRAEVLSGLVDIKALDPSIVVDLKYASTDNFTRKADLSGQQPSTAEKRNGYKTAASQRDIQQGRVYNQNI